MSSAPEVRRRPAPPSTATRGPALLAVAAIVGLLAGCTPTGSTSDASSPTLSAPSEPASPPPSAIGETPTPSPSPATLPVTVELTSGEIVLRMALPADVGEPAVEPADDGSARLVLDGPRLPAGVSPVVTLDSPGELTGKTDGSLTVVGADAGTATGGLTAPDGGRWRVVDATTAELVADDAEGAVTTTLGTAGVVSAVWGDREGGRSLAVEPTSWARDAGEAGVDVVWSELITDDPALETATMHDQLVCHSIGAPDKATWNLEPWRPDVGLLTVLAERCNPTEDL